MLMKPPSIFEDVVSQDSENYTVQSKQPSFKGKGGRKETTLRMGPPIDQRERSNDRDNDSVHSNGSKRSKDKRAKETTLARPKIAEPASHREEDSHSVHSNGSRHSQKSSKKENNIMQRPKIQQPRPRAAEPAEPSFKFAIGDPEESVIKRYRLEQEDSPQPLNYNHRTTAREPERKDAKKYAPFAELEHRQGSEEEIPIFRIEEPAKNTRPVVGLSRPDDKRYLGKIEERRDGEPREPPVEQSSSVFDQSKMGQTKSVRRPIFARDELSNNSKVSNIDQSNVLSLDSTSRRKSNSKLRQLFNNSREKQSIEQSVNESSLADLTSQSRAIKPAVGNERMVQLERKVVDPENDNFGIDSVKSGVDLARSGLDLTVSNNEHVDRDSLIFQFEPEKKKGMTVTSKNKKLHSSEQELIKIADELTSAKPKKGIKETAEYLPQLKANIESKDLRHVDKLLKDNEQYLRNSALLNLSESDKLKKDSGEDYLFKIEDDPDDFILGNAINTPWNQNPKIEEPLNIKRVERNEKLPSKPADSMPSKPAETLPSKSKETLPSKPKEPLPEVRLKEQGTEKQVRAKEQPKEYERVKPKQQKRNSEPQYLSKPSVKEESIKSPGKISKNIESASSEPDNKSEKSNKSAKKGRTVKESAIPRDKARKIEIKNEGPRAEESFYEEEPQPNKQEISINDLSLFSKKPEVQAQPEKKPNVYRFSDDENQPNEKPKSRTDVNFYDNEARSNKPPSSRPPLSGKSAKSRSTSKDKVPKQTTIKIGSQPAAQNAFKKPAQPGKKLTLMERALQKHNESSEDGRSQDSFSSREDFSQNSRKSSNSRGSRKSIKENSIKIERKEGSLVKNKGLPPYQRKNSSNSSNHEEEMQQAEEQRRQRSIEQQQQRTHVVPNQRAIVSKNCTFIDEKGRLVQKDLIIKGRDVYGQSRMEDSTTQALDRMRRTKESHRSRSKSREGRNEKRRGSREEAESSSYENSSYCSSFYDNSSYNKDTTPKNNAYNNSGSIYTGGQPQALKEFMKPVEHVPLYNQANNERRQPEAPRTLNDMFGKKQQQQQPNYGQSTVSNFDESRTSRRSLKRTENSARKR